MAETPDPDGEPGEVRPRPQDVLALVWKDAEGVVVVGLELGGAVVAVPAVPESEPRTPGDFFAQLAHGEVAFPVRDRDVLARGPRLSDLLGQQTWSAVARTVGEYYGLRLAGPPPGPPTTPLPPWWVPPATGPVPPATGPVHPATPERLDPPEGTPGPGAPAWPA